MVIEGDFDMCISMDIKTLGWLCKVFGDITFLELAEIIKTNRK